MAKTAKLESAALTIEEGTITRTTDGSRAVFRFNAPAQRHLPDAGYEIDVYMVFTDAQGRIVRRYHHAGKPDLEADVRILLTPASESRLENVR